MKVLSLNQTPQISGLHKERGLQWIKTTELPLYEAPFQSNKSSTCPGKGDEKNYDDDGEY